MQTKLMSDLLAGVRVSMLLVQKVQDLRDIDPEACRPPTWQSLHGLLDLFSMFLVDGE